MWACNLVLEEHVHILVSLMALETIKTGDFAGGGSIEMVHMLVRGQPVVI